MTVTRYCVRLERKIPSKWFKCGYTKSQLTIDYYSAIPPLIMEVASSERLEFFEPIRREYPGWFILKAEKVDA